MIKTSKFFLAISAICIAATGIFFTSCDDDDTYADRLEREHKQINAFLRNGVTIKAGDSEEQELLHVDGNIKVISEAEFYANDSTTDVSKNEYVLFSGSGVYMQILSKGTGKKLEDGETEKIINRYIEYNIAADTLQSTNRSNTYITSPDEMTCTNSLGLFSASFTKGVMKTLYNSASVPSAWLIPLNFINLGRYSSDEESIARVRLIVPAAQGQSDAVYNIYPCFYEITYMRGR